MKFDLKTSVSEKTRKIEVIFIALVSALFFMVFHNLLTGRMFTHDTIRWYSVFHFFADSLSNGVFPYWDPYEFGGQPFFYNISILKSYEPMTVGIIMLGKVFNISILTLYHADLLIRIWLVGIGVYLCFRQLNKYLLSGLLVFTVFLFSSFTITAFRQHGIMLTFFWTPWAMYFLLRLLKNFSLYNVVGFSFFVGLSTTSYHGVYMLTYLFIFILTLLVNKRTYLLSLLTNVQNLAIIVVGVGIVVVLSLPLFSVYFEKDKTVPTARIEDQVVVEGEEMRYNLTKTTGTSSNLPDFLELGLPVLIRGYYRGCYIELSECFLYIGIFPLLLGIVGIFYNKEEYSINFFITLILIGLLMLGPIGGVHWILSFLFYPLRFARHMHLFSGYFLFTLFYFVGHGTDIVLGRLPKKNS